jgi:2-iminobutanoate/2-iminopropanoate deaminase
MSKKVITSSSISRNPFFSPAIKAGDYVFVSGQVGALDEQGKPITGIEAQTKQSLANMKLVLETASVSLNDVVKTTVFLTKQEDFAPMNKVYASFFPKDPPARSTIIVVALAKPEYIVEIECVAHCP